MVQVTFRNNGEVKVILLPATTTIREAIAQSGIDWSTGQTYMGGVRVNDLDKTFADYGVSESVFLINVTDGKNA